VTPRASASEPDLNDPRPRPRSSPAPRHARRTWPARALAALLAASLALGGPAAAQVRLPALGESASEDLSVGAERRIGDQILREVRRDPDFLDDPVLLAYVQSLWEPLLAAGRATGNIDAELEQQFAWEIFLVRDRSVNAFAWPGGYVGVHLGLIAITSNRDQLASVMAHELSHVSQRHIARGISNSRNASLISIATLLLGILAASRANNTDVANAAITGGQAAGIQTQLNYSRDVEREADRVGFGLLAHAGFAPAGMAQMFEKMDFAQRINDSGGFPYLRTHPLTVDRISEARNRVLLAGNAPLPPDPMHLLMQLRARVLMDTNPQALGRLAAGASSSPLAADRVAALYGGSLAQVLLGDPARAEELVVEARRAAAGLAPRDPAVERTLALQQAQARLARGDAVGSLKLLDELAAGGVDRPLLLLRARAALAWGQRDAAAAAGELRAGTEALQTWVSEHRQDAQAWELLAATAEAIGQKLRSMRAGAEARAVLGDLNGAIDRLRVAQASARGAGSGQEFIEASVIDARLRQLERERRQIILELRQQRGEGPPP
jgi:predicted Zn-dependent protease